MPSSPPIFSRAVHVQAMQLPVITWLTIALVLLAPSAATRDSIRGASVKDSKPPLLLPKPLPNEPDSSSNSTCPDAWYLKGQDTRDCVCGLVQGCGIRGPQVGDAPS